MFKTVLGARTRCWELGPSIVYFFQRFFLDFFQRFFFRFFSHFFQRFFLDFFQRFFSKIFFRFFSFFFSNSTVNISDAEIVVHVPSFSEPKFKYYLDCTKTVR